MIVCPPRTRSRHLLGRRKVKQKVKMEENYCESIIQAGKILENSTSIQKLRKKVISEHQSPSSFLPALSYDQTKTLKMKLIFRPCKFKVFNEIRTEHSSFQEMKIIVWKENLGEKLKFFFHTGTLS